MVVGRKRAEEDWSELDAEANVERRSSEVGPIVVAEARERMWELFEREQVPQEVRQTLTGSLAGDLRRQQLLFQAMVDTWPRLQKALGEVKRAARRAPWRVNAFCERGESPGAAAEGVARTVERAMWGMRPDPVRGLKGFEGMVEELAAGYFLGHQVMELHWARDARGWQPRAAKVVPPRYYGYPNETVGGDRLMLDASGGAEGFQAYEDFPRHRFLVAVNGGHAGHAAVAAPLRALTGYWLAAVYGLKWLMSHAQVFGQPVRWAEYVAGDARAKAEIQQMMQRIGTEAWGIFPAGTKLNFVEAGKSAASLPQRELLALADEQCDVFILGQNLTSHSGQRGTQALGTVHREVRQEVMEGVCDFVGEVLTHQFAPAVVELNYGEDRTLMPEIRAAFEKPKDEKAMAERDVMLGVGTTLPVGKAWFYERHGIPVPAGGEVLRDEIRSMKEER